MDPLKCFNVEYIWLFIWHMPLNQSTMTYEPSSYLHFWIVGWNLKVNYLNLQQDGRRYHTFASSRNIPRRPFKVYIFVVRIKYKVDLTNGHRHLPKFVCWPKPSFDELRFSVASVVMSVRPSIKLRLPSGKWKTVQLLLVPPP